MHVASLLCALGLLLAVPSRGQDAPFAPFARAEVGAWSCVTVTREAGGATTRHTLAWRVEAVTGDEVRVRLEVRDEDGRSALDGDAGLLVLDRRGPVAIERLFEGAGLWWPMRGAEEQDPVRVERLKTERERLEVDGRAYDCHTVSWRATLYTRRQVVVPGPPQDVEVTRQARFSFSEDVGGSGLVALGLEEHVEGDPPLRFRSGRWSATLSGFGVGERAQVGKTPAEVDPWSGELPPARLFPAHGLAGAAPGDWQALTRRVTRGDGAPEVSTVTYRVTDATAHEVQLASTAGPGEPRWLSRARPPLLDLLLPMRPGVGRGAVTALELADERRTVGGRAFDCRRLSFSEETEVRDGCIVIMRRLKLTAWCSPEVKPLGLVALDLEVDGVLHEYSLTGFGRGDQVSWGSAGGR